MFLAPSLDWQPPVRANLPSWLSEIDAMLVDTPQRLFTFV